MSEATATLGVPTGNVRSERPFWKESLAPYARPHLGHSTADILTSVVPYLALSAGMYFLARARGKRFFAKGWAAKLLPPASIRELERVYRKHGMVGIFVSRFLPGLRAAVTPFGGVVGMPAARALVPAAVASAIWYAFLVAVGASLGRNWAAAQQLLGSTNRILGIVGLVAAVVVGLWIWRRRRAA